METIVIILTIIMVILLVLSFMATIWDAIYETHIMDTIGPIILLADVLCFLCLALLFKDVLIDMFGAII
jgi:hypothetical protein